MCIQNFIFRKKQNSKLSLVFLFHCLNQKFLPSTSLNMSWGRLVLFLMFFFFEFFLGYRRIWKETFRNVFEKSMFIEINKTVRKTWSWDEPCSFLFCSINPPTKRPPRVKTAPSYALHRLAWSAANFEPSIHLYINTPNSIQNDVLPLMTQIS